MNQSQPEQPSVPVPQSGGALKWLIIILVIAILGGGGYWYYAGYKSGTSTPSSSPSSSNKNLLNCIENNKEFLISSYPNQEKFTSIQVPCEWIPALQEENNRIYYDRGITLYPTISDKEKEESFLNQNITAPTGTATPPYVQMFERNDRFIAAGVRYVVDNTKAILNEADKIHQGYPIFDKILIENKKINGTEYHCFQDKKDEKYLVWCSAKISNNYLASYWLSTNLANYNSDISNLYKIIETTTVKQ